jgi:hypothetical protein
MGPLTRRPLTLAKTPFERVETARVILGAVLWAGFGVPAAREERVKSEPTDRMPPKEKRAHGSCRSPSSAEKG